jgi:hypothetical protein
MNQEERHSYERIGLQYLRDVHGQMPHQG